MSRPILSLNKSKNIVNNSSETKPIKNMQAKTQQEAPQQPKKKNKADVNAKKKQHRIDRIAQHWALFSEPEAKPLMIGIKEAMIAEVKDKVLDIPESHIKQGLRSYISRKAYLKALTLGGNRFDMNGQPNGEITPEQQAIAEKKLVEWIKNSKVTTARA
ncbi:ProQ/FINO family protein [Proteus terrae]|uniref:ProQ/FINO family protein n=1 Tax=Proteus terrae TaxID=1574161 RepID=UPI001E4AA57E|nr:ProQ/FINO family protein [Proteus terrae]